MHCVSEHKSYPLCKHACGVQGTALNRWTKAPGNLCSASSGLSPCSASAQSGPVCKAVCKARFLPETMQSDGLSRRTVSGTLFSICLYYISPLLQDEMDFGCL